MEVLKYLIVIALKFFHNFLNLKTIEVYSWLTILCKFRVYSIVVHCVAWLLVTLLDNSWLVLLDFLG